MPPRRRTMSQPNDSSRPRRSPATTPEGRENQLVSLAADLAERQLVDGTASAQVITHYLKLGSTREALEQQRLKHENELLQAKRESMESSQRMEERYTEAINAFRSYQGHSPVVEPDDD